MSIFARCALHFAREGGAGASLTKILFDELYSISATTTSLCTDLIKMHNYYYVLSRLSRKPEPKNRSSEPKNWNHRYKIKQHCKWNWIMVWYQNRNREPNPRFFGSLGSLVVRLLAVKERKLLSVKQEGSAFSTFPGARRVKELAVNEKLFFPL